MTLNEPFRMPGRVPQQVIDAAIRTDFYSFIQAFFSIVFPGQLFLDNFHIEAIAYALIRVMRGKSGG